MMDMVLEALEDAFVDTVKLIPFLFITYLLMEWMERKTQDKQTKMLAKVGRLGPVFGAITGIVPQCGFSAAAASLYAGGLLTIGTLLAVFLSSSDEMLPMLISNRTAPSIIVHILTSKVLIGMISGLGVDFILRFTKYEYKTKKRIHDLCDAEQCGNDEEEGSILHSALIHTAHIIIFVFLITFGLTFLVEGLGSNAIASFLNTQKVIGVFLSALVGLIPNCGSSVAITQLYIDGMLGSGQMMAGLLVNAGVGLLVLFRTNRHPKENIKIASVLYVIGVFWGLLFEGLNITF